MIKAFVLSKFDYGDKRRKESTFQVHADDLSADYWTNKHSAKSNYQRIFNERNLYPDLKFLQLR